MKIVGRVHSNGSRMELIFGRDATAQLPDAHRAPLGIELFGVLWHGTLGKPPSYTNASYLHDGLTSSVDGQKGSAWRLMQSFGFQPRTELEFEGASHLHLRLVKIDGKPVPSQPPHHEPSNSPRMKHPLNLILHGPPGTGKTYATARIAVEIIKGSAPTDRAELLKTYRELRDAEQIGFVTFHQSYSYEEFVEGIRPVLHETGGDNPKDVGYVVHRGIFRRMCTRAARLGRSTSPTTAPDLDDAQFWKMSLGEANTDDESSYFGEAILQGKLILGYGGDVDYTGCDDRSAVRTRMQEQCPQTLEDTSYPLTAVDTFKNRMQVGDLVVVSHGNLKFRAIGRITGDYEFHGAESGRHRRSVQWLWHQADSPLEYELISKKRFSQQTVHELHPANLHLQAIAKLLSAPSADATDAPPDNYVLIIDEINRGNIAKILGELITLLEPDKRIGGKEELRVRLPYSAEAEDGDFGVPDNLYIIGTMNTADRSIALMDTALRRRFRFRELAPDPNALSTIGGVDLGAFLRAINDRIELLFDRDHCIGHALFIHAQSLSEVRDVVVDQVWPLLNEYFYGDQERIAAVLGCSTNAGSTPQDSTPMLITEKVTNHSVDASLFDDPKRLKINPAFASAGEAELAAFFVHATQSSQ